MNPRGDNDAAYHIDAKVQAARSPGANARASKDPRRLEEDNAFPIEDPRRLVEDDAFQTEWWPVGPHDRSAPDKAWAAEASAPPPFNVSLPGPVCFATALDKEAPTAGGCRRRDANRINYCLLNLGLNRTTLQLVRP